MRALPVAFLLLVATLAGCAGPAQTSEAKPLLSVAEEAARSWQPDALLVSVHAAEMANGTEYVAQQGTETDEMDEALLAHDDVTPGDGRAPAWGFIFSSKAANRSYEVVVSATGNVLASGPGNSSFSSPIAMEHWKIDAGRAWSLAKEGNATMRSATAQGPVLAGQMLWSLPNRPHPLWLLFAAEGPEDNEGTFVLVDADNGTLYGFDALFAEVLRGLLPVFQEVGSVAGLLAAHDPSATHSFDVNQPHHRVMAVSLVMADETPPGQRVSLVLTGPGGNAVLHLNHTRATAISDVPDHGLVHAPQNGTYTVSVTLDPPGASGVAASYRMAWCTDGQDLGLGAFGFSGEACEFVPASQGPKAPMLVARP